MEGKARPCGEFQPDVENCEKPEERKKEKSEEVDESWIAEGFECEDKRVWLNFLGIEETVWNLDQGEYDDQSTLGKSE